MRVWIFLTFVFVATGCPKDETTPPIEDASSEVGTEDTGRDATPPDLSPDLGVDSASDLSQTPLVEVRLKNPTEPPTDLLDGTGLESCEVFQESACVNGTQRRCGLYDPAAQAFVTPDPLVERALMFDRWYDLYHQPQGQTAERSFNRAIDPGTPESEWGDPAAFAGYPGLYDAAIWNGAALLSATMRYSETGTEADYDRMERKVRDMLLQFDVTGIPGYLARYHFLNVSPGDPRDPQYVIRSDVAPFDHRFRPFDPTGVPDLPAHYTQGYDVGGQTYTGTPMFAGNPSIDQYSGARIGFSVAYNLMRDESVKQRIADHMTCYLKRLQRVEIRNLQQNQELVTSLTNYLTGSTNFRLDPTDPDLTALDTIVIYISPMINTLNEDAFDRSCPDSVQLEPARIIDATENDLVIQMVDLATDMNSKATEKESSIDHFYVANVRGADAIHLMHLAAFAYYVTDDPQYLSFLQESLGRDLNTVQTAYTAGAFNLNRYCRRYYGHHISFSPTWAFLRLLDDSELRTHIETVYDVEMWQKEMFDQDNIKFNLMYAGEVPNGTDASTVRDRAVELMATMGGNANLLLDPRRAYDVDPAARIANLPQGNSFVCPSQAEVDSCESEISVLGITLPGEDITETCTGDPRECVTANGDCTEGMAANPMPPELRRYEDFAWQRNPYVIPGPQAISGNRQSPGLDVTEEFWLARFYDFVTEGEGQALAWEDLGACNN